MVKIVAIIVAVFVGVLATQFPENNDNENEIIEHLRSLGARVVIGDDGVAVEISLSRSDRLKAWKGKSKDLALLSKLKRLSTLSMQLDLDTSQNQTSFLASLDDLEVLHIGLIPVANMDLAESISKCKSLRELSVYAVNFENFSLKPIAKNLKRLESIELRGHGMASSELRHLVDLGSLRSADLTAFGVMSIGMLAQISNQVQLDYWRLLVKAQNQKTIASAIRRRFGDCKIEFNE